MAGSPLRATALQRHLQTAKGTLNYNTYRQGGQWQWAAAVLSLHASLDGSQGVRGEIDFRFGVVDVGQHHLGFLLDRPHFIDGSGHCPQSVELVGGINLFLHRHLEVTLLVAVVSGRG